MKTKGCTGCNEEKPISHFYAAKGYRGGYNSRCKPCLSAYHQKRYLGQREQRSAQWHAKYYADLDQSRERGRLAAENLRRKRGIKPKMLIGPESEEERQQRFKKYQRRYYERHREQIQRSQQTYRERHPEHVKATKTNFKAKSKGADGSISPTEWKSILLFYGRACALCHAKDSERPLTIDHYIPVSRGGSNDWRNVWPLCLPCNVKKGRRMPAEREPPHVATFDNSTPTSAPQAEAQ